jgi:hypothetical protein
MGLLRRQELKETDVIKACLDLLDVRGWVHHRLHCGRFWTIPDKRVITMNPAGTPDFLCAHPRYPAFYMETKRPRGALTAVQEFKKIWIERSQHLCVIKIDNPYALKQWLDQIEKGET